MASIDSQQLLLLAGSDTQQMRAIVEHFRVDALVTAKDCEAVAKAGDIAGCKRLIHRLKGSSGSLGFIGLYEFCLDLEQSGKIEKYQRSIVHIDALIRESVELALKELD